MRVLVMFLLSVFSAVASAQTPLPAEQQAQWNAIGRINIAGYKSRSMCTGALIAADQVLTARHCLTGPAGEFAPPSDIHFLAGYRRGEFIAHRRGSVILEAEPAPPTASAIAGDLAILKLDAPINNAPPLPISRWSTSANKISAPLTLIAYRFDRPHIAGRQDDCEIIDENGVLLALSCRVAPGNSGGPLIHFDEKGASIIAVVSASSRRTEIGAIAVIAEETRFYKD